MKNPTYLILYGQRLGLGPWGSWGLMIKWAFVCDLGCAKTANFLIRIIPFFSARNGCIRWLKGRNLSNGYSHSNSRASSRAGNSPTLFKGMQNRNQIIHFIYFFPVRVALQNSFFMDNNLIGWCF